MKAKSLLIALSMAVCASAAATSIDVTNHPDREFFDGYERLYKQFEDGSQCVAAYAQLRSGHELISLNALCDGLGITEEKIRDDLAKATKHVKEKSSAESFRQFFRISGNRYFSTEPYGLCIFRESAIYVFSDTQSQNNPEWKIISITSPNLGSGRNQYGLWKNNQNGTITAQLGLSKIQPEIITISLHDMSQCDTLKPYDPDLLRPSR